MVRSAWSAWWHYAVDQYRLGLADEPLPRARDSCTQAATLSPPDLLGLRTYSPTTSSSSCKPLPCRLQATALRLSRASQGAAASTGFLLRLLDQQTLKSCDTDKGEWLPGWPEFAAGGRVGRPMHLCAMHPGGLWGRDSFLHSQNFLLAAGSSFMRLWSCWCLCHQLVMRLN